MNLQDSNPQTLKLPRDGLHFLSQTWAGSGSLYDWLVPSEWSVSREWSAEVVRARYAESVLWAAENVLVPKLPSGLANWMDQFQRNLHRIRTYSESPTAHTDWALTLSEFGRYPAPTYVDRRPLSTFDSPHSRVSLWLADAIAKAESLIRARFNRAGLSEEARSKLITPAQICRALQLTPPDDLYDEDLNVCTSAGGCWSLIAKLARQLSVIWKRDAKNQISLLPATLPALGSQLFELATLGASAAVVKSLHPLGKWRSLAPMGASEKAKPCLVCEESPFEWAAYYQVVPPGKKKPGAPYETLGAGLNVQSLRPDIWLKFTREDGRQSELVIESKYSLDPSYIASGITQVLGYSLEHPPVPPCRRFYMVVGPEEVVSDFTRWKNRFFVGNIQHLKELTRQLATGEL